MTWYTKKWDPRFDDDLPDSWAEPHVVRVGGSDDAEQAFALMESCPRHTFVLPMTDIDLKWMVRWFASNKHPMPPNVIPAALVADQAEADARIPLLSRIPARYRLVLAEGLRGPMNLTRWIGPWIGCSHYDGGCVRPENVFASTGNPASRPGAESCRPDGCPFGYVGGVSSLIVSGGTEPMHPAWVRSLRDQCEDAGVAFRFEGWGDWIGGEYDRRKAKFIGQATEPGKTIGRIFWSNPGEPKVRLWNEADHYWTHASARVGHSASGRLLDGVRHDALPWDKEGGQ
jgi:protein gp37